MTGTPILIHARGIALEAAADDIQIMPPGAHDIEPMGEDGKPVALKVLVNAATAQALEAARDRYQAEADAGTGDAPYFDFNHADGPAAAWVKSIYWGGEDPKTGGVRAKIEWSDAGRDAVEGKTFRRFSPSFAVDAQSGTITDAPVNMGGLVNRAAFRSINAFFAQKGQAGEDTGSSVRREIKRLRDGGMTVEEIGKRSNRSPSTLGSIESGEIANPPQELLTSLKNITTPEVKAKDPINPTQPTTTMTEEEIAGLKAENQALKEQIATLTAQVEAAAKTEAEALVQAAAEKGAIPADQEVKAKWVRALLSNPEHRELLASLPVPAALIPTLKVQAKPGEDANTPAAVKARYDAMSDGAERDAYRREHAAVLLHASREAKS